MTVHTNGDMAARIYTCARTYAEQVLRRRYISIEVVVGYTL